MRVRLWNSKAEELTGYTRNEALGRSLVEAFVHYDEPKVGDGGMGGSSESGLVS